MHKKMLLWKHLEKNIPFRDFKIKKVNEETWANYFHTSF